MTSPLLVLGPRTMPMVSFLWRISKKKALISTLEVCSGGKRLKKMHIFFYLCLESPRAPDKQWIQCSQNQRRSEAIAQNEINFYNAISYHEIAEHAARNSSSILRNTSAVPQQQPVSHNDQATNVESGDRTGEQQYSSTSYLFLGDTSPAQQTTDGSPAPY